LTDVYGVARDTASGIALLAHAISFIPITLIGLALFAATPMRVKKDVGSGLHESPNS
jgi:hypothetical protein